MHWPGADFFDRFLLASLLGFYLWAAVKGWRLNRSGVKVNESNSPVSLASFLNRFIPTLRSYEIIACAWPLKLHFLPTLLRDPLTDFLPLKIGGALLWLAALGLYIWAQLSMGQDWRIGTSTDAALVTRGALRHSRHPIYLAFLLMAWGTAAIYLQPAFLLLAVISSWLLYYQMGQEEDFLQQHFGQTYRDYCQRTSRYFTI